MSSYRLPFFIALVATLIVGVSFGYIFLGRAIDKVAGATFASGKLPDLADVPAQSTKIYDRQGNLLYEFGSERREVIKIQDVPADVKNAFLAAEDKTFYTNPGFSIKSIIRAAHTDVRQDQLLQGGSTITQQLAQQLVVSKESSFQRKVREIIISFTLTRKYSKDTILERYLNEVPVGGDLVGIGTAAKVYFGVPVNQLTIAQGAYIAALINAPSTLDPYLNRSGLDSRQQLVLERMHTFGFISADQLSQAKAEHVTFLPRRTTLKEPYFSLYVRNILEQKFGQQAVEHDGLVVQTTLDPVMQQQAHQVISNHIQENAKAWNATNAALVSADPRTGQIMALVGGADFSKSQVDMITSDRQPGSTIKPLIYYTAFEQGYSPDTYVADWIEDFGGGYRPTDYGGGASGKVVTLRNALVASLNIPAVRVLRGIGIPAATDNLTKMGFPIKPGYHYTLPLALGAVDVQPLQMAQAFAVLAADGRDVRLTPLLKVTDRHGRVLLDNTNTVAGKQILDEQAVAAVTSIISDYKLKRQIYPGQMFTDYTLADRPAAAKTGTTSGPKDAWTIGYTPQLVTAVWTGNTSGENIKDNADGITTAAPIWHDFMTLALAGQPVIPFPEYQKIKLDDNHKAIDRGITVPHTTQSSKSASSSAVSAPTDVPPTPLASITSTP